MQSPKWTDNSRGVGIASMFASGSVLAIAFWLDLSLRFFSATWSLRLLLL